MYKTTAMFFLAATLAFAQDVPIPPILFSPQKYICYHVEEQIDIDGKLDESAWNKISWTNDFVDIEGPVKPNPRFRTRAKMLWDKNYFYVAAELQEPDIWGTLKNRDDIIFYDNDFEIFIDPDGDTHNYVEFEMNALNTVWDLLLKQPYRDIDNAAIHGYDIKGLKSGVSINGTLNQSGDKDNCWTVEVALPWEAFKEITPTSVPPKDTDQWRVNFSRVEWKTEVVDGKYHKVINPATNKPFPEDNWVWSPQGVVNMHYPEMWGYVQFTNALPCGEKVSFIENNIEAVKWYLRQIYYNEKIYFKINNTYTHDISKLNITADIIPGFVMPPSIEYTTNLFEAFVLSDDGSQKIRITNSGLTEIIKIKK
ncbi:MAG: carbohydrate-binding family 9-like protein [bacterium]